ncbi:hypothetical protein D3C75_953850 [compost metagenome]
MIRILIVALSGVKRNTGGIFFGKAHLCGTLAWGDLDGERLVGTQHLKQERQFTKALCHFGTQLFRLVGINHLTQRTQVPRLIRDL